MKRIPPFKRLLCLALSTTLAIGFAQCAAAADKLKSHSAITPVQRNVWQDRNAMFNRRVAQGDVDMILIGDSITHSWESKGKEVWEKYYAPRRTVNLGISGDCTQHVLWRLQHGNIEGISPKLAMLMIGTNNVGTNSPQEIADGVEAIVRTLRCKLPETKILVLGIFPRDAESDGVHRRAITEINQLIAKLDDDCMVHYLDISDRFLDADGTLSKTIMPDLLHPSAAGYQIWAEAVEPFVAKLMGPLPAQNNPAAEQQCGFTSLFDGKSLDGWRQAGGEATYCVDDGCIVGAVGPGPNSFLCTEKNYADFIFEVDVKMDVPGNSGIMFRSHRREEDGVVYGYQCEIDPSSRAWTGGIYDESRRGWLYDLKDKPAARKAFKPNGWNRLVIKAEGPSIKTWVNGVACTDLTDTADAEGFIALQVHAGESGRIRWRNIRIKELNK